MARIWILPVCLFLSFVGVAWSVFDEPIDGPTGMTFFFDFRRNHLMVYSMPSGDLQEFLYVPAYDIAYWPKKKAMLYTYNGVEIRAFNIWGDLNDTLIINRDMLATNEYWVYVRLEVRENWILGGAIDVLTSRINLYRLTQTKTGGYNITLLASEIVTSSRNLIIHPTMSPSSRHVYAVQESGIFRVSYDGGDTELVLEDEFAVNPNVVELEHRLYFVTGQDRNIIRSCDLDGGNLQTLYTSSVRVGAAEKYGEWLVISEENGVKEYQFLNLNTNETRKILNEPFDGSNYLVGRLDFLGVREECQTYSLILPAVITTDTREDVTITTAISSAGNVSYQYFSSFDRLRFTGTGFELPDTAERQYSHLDPATLVLPRDNTHRAERQGVYLNKIITPLGDEETIVAVLQSPGKCPTGYCNPPGCTDECPVCYNGGVPRQDTIHGEICVCAPGFKGPNCEKATDSGTFGRNGELSCPNADCRGVLICQVDPYGCSCMSGYMGSDCKTQCRRGYFGPNCMVECHCRDNSLCDRRTGRCRDHVCEAGWQGFNCQVPSP